MDGSAMEAAKEGGGTGGTDGGMTMDAPATDTGTTPTDAEGVDGGGQ